VQTGLKMMNIGYTDWPARAKFVRIDKDPILCNEASECVKPDFFFTFFLDFQAPNEPGEHMIFFQLEAH
jgi:hypothetical protein